MKTFLGDLSFKVHSALKECCWHMHTAPQVPAMCLLEMFKFIIKSLTILLQILASWLMCLLTHKI